MTQQTTQLFTAQSSFKKDWAKLNLFDISRKPSLDYMGTFSLEPQFSKQINAENHQNQQFQTLIQTDESDPYSTENNDSSFLQNSPGTDFEQDSCFKNVPPMDYFEGLLKSENLLNQFPENSLFPAQDASIPNFELPQSEKQQQQKQMLVKQESSGSRNQRNIFNIQKKKIVKQPKQNAKNYDKNICRYLTRRTIRCFANFEYYEQVLKFCNGNRDLYSEATEFFTRRIELITGFRVLKEYLDVIGEPDPKIKQIKQVFKEFYKWFLKERIVRYIMKGEMTDKLMYIKYKNEVMLQYADTLQDWKSNKSTSKKAAKKKSF